jgi:putative ABC transport system permease protein
MQNDQTPPGIFLRFFRWYCHPKLTDHIEGDLLEVYGDRLKKSGKTKADRKFVVDVLLLFRPGIIRPVEGYKNLNTFGMYKSYFKIGLRNLLKNKGYSFINVFGLALAIACSLVIFLFINDEFKYDRYHRVSRDFVSEGVVNMHLAQVAPPVGPLLKNDFAGIEEQVRTLRSYYLVRLADKKNEGVSFYENNVFYAEPQLLHIFDIELAEGNPANALQNPFTLMLSRKTAVKYFGNERASGKQLVNLNNNRTFEVSGVFEDFPATSHWHPDILVAFSTLSDSTIYGQRRLETNWGNNAFYTYLLTVEGFDPKKIEPQFPGFIDKYMGPYEAPSGVLPSTWTNLHLQKLTDIHLRSRLDTEIEANGSISTVYIIGVIGLFIILIASFNFVNLSTARAINRAKEVGLRKVVGAYRNQLITQHLCESLLTTLLAFILSLGILPIVLTWANDFTKKQIDLSQLTASPTVGLAVLAFIMGVGFISGIYPAFIISGYRPSVILKGNTSSAQNSNWLRKTLVVAQFSISIGVVIATMVVYYQLQFLNSKELGYNKDQLITMYLPGDLNQNYETFRNELSKHSTIESVCRSSYVPASRVSSANGARVQKGDSLAMVDFAIRNVRIDFDFFETYEIKLASGRFFSRSIKTDDSIAYILNESAVRKLGWSNEDAINKDFQYGDIKGKVIGVVRDFHFESLYEEITPLVFFPGRNYGSLSVKLAGTETLNGIAHVEKVWKDFVPNRPFVFEFLDQRYQHLYEGEQKQGQLFAFFSGLAIFIACLGLFGLATYNTLQRVKEIGIRKVLGASVQSIVRMLSMEMIRLIVIANVIAWPVAWYFMDRWLEKFAYRVDNDIWLYLAAGSLTLMVALLTISIQSIKVAMTNPVKSLRTE